MNQDIVPTAAPRASRLRLAALGLATIFCWSAARRYKLVSGAEAESARDRAAGLLSSFHGVNPMQLVYLSQMGAYGAERSCNEMFHTWFRDGDKRWDSSKDSEFGPAPGYVTGGPNKDYWLTSPDLR